MPHYNTTKQCKTCQKFFPSTPEYFTIANKKRGILSSECKSCKTKRTADWRKRNPNRRLESDRKRKEANPELHKLIKHIEYVDNFERYAKWAKEYGKQYRKDHPEKIRNYVRKRRALLKNAEGTFTDKDIENILTNQNYCCAYCGVKLGHDTELDHIKPLSKGGTNWPDNLALVCRYCNRSKGQKDLDVWLKERGQNHAH